MYSIADSGLTITYTTVDGRRLVAVANTLGALVVGGVHSTVASRAKALTMNTGRRCLNSVNCQTLSNEPFIPEKTLRCTDCRKIYYFPKSMHLKCPNKH